MRKHNIVKHLFFIIFLLGFFGSKANPSTTVDSVLMERIIKVGQQKLNALISQNEQFLKEGKTDKLRFVVNVNPEDYITDRAIGSKPNYLSTSSMETALNARLNQVATTYNISCYYILISYFDVKIAATMPDQYTLDELFNTGKFFQENTNIKALEDYHGDITTNIISNITTATNNYFVFSLAKYCAAEFQNSSVCYGFYKTDTVKIAGAPVIPYFKNTFSYFKTHLKNNTSFKTAQLNDDRVDKALISLETAAKNAPLKAQILNTYTSEGITSILQNFTSTDYFTLSLEERLHCLSVYAGYSMSGNITIFNNNEEGYALKLIKYINKNELVQFYNGLSAQSTVKNNILYNGNKDNKALIVKLIDRIDDGILGGENYGKLISIIINHFNQSEALLENYLATQNYETKEYKYYSTDIIPTTTEAGNIRYTVVLNDNGMMHITGEIAYYDINLVGDCINIGDGCTTTYWDPYCDDDNVHPFSLIFFSNYSKLSMIEELNETEEIPLIAPAIVLKYCDDKDFNNVTVKRLSSALDVVTLISGVGTIKQALKTQKYAKSLYEIAQVLSASGNIAVNATNDPDITQLKQEYDNIMLVWDMANIVSGSGKIMTKAYNSLKNGTAKKISKTTAQSFITRYEQLKLAGKQLPTNFKKLYVYLKSKIGGSSLQGAGSLASHVDIQQSLATILNLKSTNKLTKSIGNASDLELGSIHKYTEDGRVILTSMRNGNETVIDAVNFNQFQSQLYQSIKSGLTKLRQTNRLVTGTVIRGRTYTLADFNTLFNSGSTNIPLKGMVSCTKNEAVAIDFLTKSGTNISGSKVKVIMKINSKNGVDIDDFSDWGANLVNQRHPGALIQEEVLLEEGMFKMIGQPKPILENGVPKFDADAVTPWIEVELEELATPLRNIN